MNIKIETVEALKGLGYMAHLQDDNLRHADPEKATGLFIGYYLDDDDMKYIGLTIKSTKKETTLEAILEKINNKLGKESQFKNIQKIVADKLAGTGLQAMATSYGIGVFVAVGFRTGIEQRKQQIENILNELGVEYKTEYSDAGWVFRYKISKSSQNLDKLK